MLNLSPHINACFQDDKGLKLNGLNDEQKPQNFSLSINQQQELMERVFHHTRVHNASLKDSKFFFSVSSIFALSADQQQ